MARTLIVYYSLTGNTAKVAALLAAKLPADLERIEDLGKRTGTIGLLRCAYESVFNKTPPILPRTKQAADYDLVILGTPVWGQNMASPMRSFIEQERAGLKKVALFCTVGAVGGPAAIREMARLCGREPIASLVLLEKDLRPAVVAGRIDAFVREIERTAGEIVRRTPSPPCRDGAAR